ncbi:MAG TPA: hypothetical protein VN613_12540 [Gemmatimonadaceae bacterium]|nr:hypothetical protein [Gemmatimonadaceae bacterium]
MRRGYHNGFELGSDGLIAVNLGADHVAEHEWGIAGIRRAFGMQDDEKVFGLERRKVTKRPVARDWRTKVESPALRWMTGTAERHEDRRTKKLTVEGLYFDTYGNDEHFKMPCPYADEPFWSGWSEKDFGAFAYDEKSMKRLRETFDAFQELDVAIWLGGGGIFQNAGLVIGIVSRLPAHVIKAWDKGDREHAKLKADAKATGIEERLKAAGKGFFALSPRRDSDGSLVFWLNPMEQRHNNFGWFTVADLDAWIRGEGPVPMTQRKVGGR